MVPLILVPPSRTRTLHAGDQGRLPQHHRALADTRVNKTTRCLTRSVNRYIYTYLQTSVAEWREAGIPLAESSLKAVDRQSLVSQKAVCECIHLFIHSFIYLECIQDKYVPGQKAQNTTIDRNHRYIIKILTSRNLLI